MATSFLPNSEDASTKPYVEPTETPQSQPSFETQEPNIEIPATEMPVENMEGHPEANEHFLEESQEVPETAAPTPVAVTQSVPPPTQPIPSMRDEFAVQIEKILEENLGDVFLALTPVQKQQFKIKGEETANKIRHILTTTKAKLGKIVKIIFEWLKILPGINRFFLEQEAKIKAEKIIALSEHQKHMK